MPSLAVAPGMADLRETVDSVYDLVVADHELATRIAAHQIWTTVRESDPLLGADAATLVVNAVLARLHGLGPLEPVLTDPAITEVMVNGPGPVWVERSGGLVQTDVHLDRETIELIIERIVAPLGLRADRSSPMVDARLPDGSRVNAVLPPLAVDGPYVTIRRFASGSFGLSSYCEGAEADLLAWAVDARLNIVVSGGTGAGKTSLLNALAGEIAPGERVVTIEDAAELALPGEHVIRLEARPANAEGAGRIDTRTLVRNALRMRPDRIIVGEVRGAEALDMVQAMNTGHEGSLSTCHANGPADALRRLETMILMNDLDLPLVAIRDYLHAAIDVIVQVTRTSSGERRVDAICEVDRIDEALVVVPIDPATGPRRCRRTIADSADGSDAGSLDGSIRVAEDEGSICPPWSSQSLAS